MAVLTITKDNFKTEVVESDKPVLLDFWASWCAPCMMQSPIVDELAEEHPELKGRQGERRRTAPARSSVRSGEHSYAGDH